MKNLVGTRVYGVNGPGQKPTEEMAGRKGEVKEIISERFIDGYRIEWEDGEVSDYAKHTVKPASEAKGIGVYY